MRKLYEIFKLLWIQKRIVAAATIWGNTVSKLRTVKQIEVAIAMNTVFPHIVATATILFWIHKSLKISYR